MEIIRAHDRDQWWAVVNMVLNLHIPLKGKKPTSYETINLLTGHDVYVRTHIVLFQWV
jgi:hypothetical protein